MASSRFNHCWQMPCSIIISHAWCWWIQPYLCWTRFNQQGKRTDHAMLFLSDHFWRCSCFPLKIRTKTCSFLFTTLVGAQTGWFIESITRPPLKNSYPLHQKHQNHELHLMMNQNRGLRWWEMIRNDCTHQQLTQHGLLTLNRSLVKLNNEKSGHWQPERKRKTCVEPQ